MANMNKTLRLDSTQLGQYSPANRTLLEIPPVDGLPPTTSARDYFLIFYRRRALFFLAFLAIFVTGAAITLMTKPVYRASAKLLVDGPAVSINSVDTANPLSSLLATTQPQSVETQVEVLQADPLIDQALSQTGPAAISVSEVPGTNVIDVSAEANSPKIAAAAPNALLDLYLNSNVNKDLNEIRTAKQFVTTEGAKAHARLTATEDALERFKQSNHLIDLNANRQDEIEHVNGLEGDVEKDSIQLGSLQRELDKDRQLLQAEPETYAVKLQSSNPRIDEIQGEINKLEQQRVSELQPGAGYTPRAWQIKQLDAQIADLKQRLDREPRLITTVSSNTNSNRQALHERVNNIEAQIAALISQLNTTKFALNQTKTIAGNYSGWELSMARLMREHDDAEAKDKMFREQATDLDLREKAHHSTARIIENAQVPSAPIRPKKAAGIIFSGLIGLFLAACLVLVREFIDDRINSVADAERLLQLRSLTQVPPLSVHDIRRLPLLGVHEPTSESYRILRTNIRFSTVGAPLQSLMVGSSSPGEGKTTTAINLALATARDGKKVILVDTDLRRPSIDKMLSLPAGPGLTDVILGTTSLYSALAQHPEIPSLSVLVCGTIPPNPSEILGSARFAAVLEELKHWSDLVIFDSAPVLLAADAAVLAAQVDGVVLVVETGQTRKAAAIATMKVLRQVGARIVGVSYNKVKQSEGQGYYGYDQIVGSNRLTSTPTPIDPNHRNGNSATRQDVNIK